MNNSQAAPLLRMEGIEKSFSGVRVLENVPFDLKPGEVHILAGENGAGKTTLVKILAGIHTDHEGEIFLQGKSVRFDSPHEAARHGIAAIHQEMSLVSSMTVADNIFLGREQTISRLWMDFRSQEKKAQAVLNRLGLEIDLSLRVEEYPVSVRQMIEIAKALVYQARILIMDEPTSALNDIEVERLFTNINDLKTHGCGIIFISHRLEEIYKIADRISVLRDGKYVGTADAGKLPVDNLIEWMVGRSIDRQFPLRMTEKMGKSLSVKGVSLKDPSGRKDWVVEDINFDLRAGEILGIAGLQGSGKSELLHGLFGDYGKISQGEVFLKDKKFVVRSPADSIAQGLILLTNDRKDSGLVPMMDLVRNMTLASIKIFSPRGWMQTRKEEEAVKKNILSFNIKAHSLDQEVQTLSGGNQQKVVLAKWLETQPQVLLLDEPTIGVDIGAKHEIYRLMHEWTTAGQAILLITSELPELLAMSDRVLVMHRGRIIREFLQNEATQEKVIQAAMGEGEKIDG